MSKQEFFENVSVLSYWPLSKLSFMWNIRKILRSISEKKAKLSILGLKFGQFGLFWPNKNFLKKLRLFTHWPLSKLSFMWIISKIIRIISEKKAKSLIFGPKLTEWPLLKLRGKIRILRRIKENFSKFLKGFGFKRYIFSKKNKEN